MTTIAGAAAECVQTLLASRILANAEAVEKARTRKCYSVADFDSTARAIEKGLAAISELERVWQDLFGYIPSIGEVHQKSAQLT